MKQYNELIKQINEYNKKLENPTLSPLDRQILELEKGDLMDQVKRMTFHISMCEEDNYV